MKPLFTVHSLQMNGMTCSGGLCERHGRVALVSAASGHVLPLSLLADREIHEFLVDGLQREC